MCVGGCIEPILPLLVHPYLDQAWALLYWSHAHLLLTRMRRIK